MEFEQQPKKRKIITWKRVAIICILILISIGLFVGYTYTTNAEYSKGVNDGQISIIKRVNQGEFPYVSQENNQTELIWITLNQVCREIN